MVEDLFFSSLAVFRISKFPPSNQNNLPEIGEDLNAGIGSLVSCIFQLCIVLIIIMNRVAKCQINYTDQNLQTKLFPKKSV